MFRTQTFLNSVGAVSRLRVLRRQHSEATVIESVGFAVTEYIHSSHSKESVARLNPVLRLNLFKSLSGQPSSGAQGLVPGCRLFAESFLLRRRYGQTEVGAVVRRQTGRVIRDNPASFTNGQLDRFANPDVPEFNDDCWSSRKAGVTAVLLAERLAARSWPGEIRIVAPWCRHTSLWQVGCLRATLSIVFTR